MLNSEVERGDINLHETMKYKNKHRLLGIEKKNIQAFLENNAQKGTVRFKRWLLWSHGASWIRFIHHIQAELQSVRTQGSVHAHWTRALQLHFTHTNTDILQLSCNTELVNFLFAEWKESLTASK